MVSLNVKSMINDEIIINTYTADYIHFKIKFPEETDVYNVHNVKPCMYLLFNMSFC